MATTEKAKVTDNVKQGQNKRNNRGNRTRNTESAQSKGQAPGRERREYSNPEITVPFQLQTQEGIRMQQRHYNSMSKALFNLTINSTSLERLGVKGAIDRTKKAVGEVLAGPEKEISSGITALNKVLEQAKTSGASRIEEVSYTAPRDYNIRVRTPDAMRVVRLFRDFDELITLLDRLWLNNLFNQDEVDDYKTRLRDSIRNMVNLLDRHASTTVEELNDNNGKNADEANKATNEQTESAEPKDDIPAKS
ncbi:AcaB family transcriptional regulator [Providencia sp. PROV255]|uniref:AcaB family transcriptional regulator n=1 Tax=Providencia sp. PROV255 TaxID=2949943 RepID=UPI0023490E17|nr:AcaB family transcriptional regulator [Providencia sp. PROV255]